VSCECRQLARFRIRQLIVRPEKSIVFVFAKEKTVVRFTLCAEPDHWLNVSMR